jgi:antitoxin component of RelBE/YafQ-DinJ toxin-antitoxin module
MKRINIKVPDELHSQFKSICTIQGKEMTEILKAFVEDYVARKGESALMTFEEFLTQDPRKLAQHVKSQLSEYVKAKAKVASNANRK